MVSSQQAGPVDTGVSPYQDQAGSFLAMISDIAPHLGLDYSVESLQRLDQFISDSFEPIGKRQLDESLPLGAGSYLGEVIVRNLGGHWNEEGKPEINEIGPIEAIFPIEKAQKRFQNGKQDALAWYYHALHKQAYEAGYRPEGEAMIAPKGDGLFGVLKGLFKK